MPPRSAKMKRRILGFQRRVWWPKWTPASSRPRVETAPDEAGSVETAMWTLLPDSFGRAPAGVETHLPDTRGTRATAGPPGRRNRDAGRLAAGRGKRGGEVRRQRRRDVDRLAGSGVGEGEPCGVEELPLE